MKHLLRILPLLITGILLRYWLGSSTSRVSPAAQDTADDLVQQLRDLQDVTPPQSDTPPTQPNGPTRNPDTNQREGKREADGDADIQVRDPDGNVVGEYSNEEVQADIDAIKKFLEENGR